MEGIVKLDNFKDKHVRTFVCFLASCLIVLIFSSLLQPTPSYSAPFAAGDLIYDDALTVDWADISWGTTVNYNETVTKHAGASGIAVTHNEAWAGFYVTHASSLVTTDYDSLRFWANGGVFGGQSVQVVIVSSDDTWHTPVTINLMGSAWREYRIPFSSLGNPGDIKQVVWQDASGAAQPTFYLDELTFYKAGATTPTPTPTAPQPSVTIYDDSLNSGWQNWSWGTTTDFSNTSPAQTGVNALSVEHTDAWTALFLHANSAEDISQYDALRFAIHGGSGGQIINVLLIDSSDNWLPPITIYPAANVWNGYELTIASLGSPQTINGLIFQEGTGASSSTYYLDEIAFFAYPESGPAPTPVPGTSTHTLTVDVNDTNHPISPYVYGLNFAEKALAAELALPVNRFGGNAVSRFNWKLDVSNRAADWYFESIPNDNVAPYDDDNGSNKFIEANNTTGTESLITIPLIGYTPKSRNRDCGFSVTKYGSQDNVDPWNTDCGNGLIGGVEITGNDPTDSSIVIDETWATEWINYLTNRYGAANGNGVKFYSLDNEPMLWHHTHRDVHPDAVGYDELRDRSIQYGAAIKAADPTSETFGPALWGWTNYFYSAIDSVYGSQTNDWDNPPDRNAHGGTDLTTWYLQQMAAYEQTNGVRILDYLDLHYYTQNEGVTLATAGSLTVQQSRMRSTRSLWDPTYVDESWIGEPVRLIPRMHDWVNDNYPGTKTALTEYNFGGVEHINGAVAHADALGIFGDENLHFATMWDPPSTTEPTAYAFRMYRNYDGSGSKFGDTNLTASSSNRDDLAVYASVRNSDGSFTIMVINKSWNNLTADVALTGYGSAGSAEVYEYSSGDLNNIVQRESRVISADTVQHTYPGQSITLLVVPSSGSPVPTPVVTATTAPLPTATSIPAATATTVPQPTATNIPAATATTVPQPTATNIPAATATTVPQPTATSIPAATATTVPQPTATNIPAATATTVPQPTATNIPAATATIVPQPTATNTPSATAVPPTATPITTPIATTAPPTQTPSEGEDSCQTSGVHTLIAISTSQASSSELSRQPALAHDGTRSTSWATSGVGEWIEFDTTLPVVIDMVELAFADGSSSVTEFSIEASYNGSVWNEAFSGSNSGNTAELERFDFSPIYGRYFRISRQGSSTAAAIELAEVHLCQANNAAPTAVVVSNIQAAPNLPSMMLVVLILTATLAVTTEAVQRTAIPHRIKSD